jgi:hypothetical protein
MMKHNDAVQKVGIITKHSVPNYGAMLQAHGLCSYLRGIGIDAELVDYDQPATTQYFSRIRRFPPAINQWLRLRRCRKFVETSQHRSLEHCTSVEEFRRFSGKYTHLITGSDQVWFTGPVQYYDPMYFLDFPFPGGRKISYAPSVGGVESFGEFEDRVRKALMDFDSISVRDANSDRLVKPLIGRDPVKVSDPTFLHDFKDLVDSRRPIAEPYMVIFGAVPAERESLLREVAERLKLKRIVSLQYPNGVATSRIPAPSPGTWLTYLYHSDFVATSYFHGTVFAMKFQKLFASFPTKGRVKKVSALLEDSALEDRLLLSDEKRDASAFALIAPIDWGRVNARVNARVLESTEFLRRALA